jgi:cytosine/adenosine deaminase-related metal-dependent hydrolase
MAEQKQIVRGRWVLQNPDDVITDGAVVIDGEQIAEVGGWRRIRERYPQAAVLGSDQHAVIPGLVNAHHHSNGVSALQHGIPDRLLEPWLLSLAKRRRAGTYLCTLLSAARLLRSGVTAVVDVYSGRGTPAEFEENVREGLRAYDEAGMRVAYAAGMSEQSFLVWDDDETFLASLPADARAKAAQRQPAQDTLTPDDYFAIFERLWQQYRTHPRIDLWFGPPGPQWVSDDFLARIAAQAAAYETGIQTHLLESVYEKQHGPRAYGRPTVLHLRDLGVLSPRLSLAHGVWLTEEEVAALAESGAHVSHNPSSNLRLRAGIAPLNAMLAAAMNVGLGMDGTTLNDDEDMFAEMRLALNLHRLPHLDAPAPTVADVWRLATTGGARLLQAGSRLGRLTPGYAADLVLLRLERILWPWVAPEADPRLLLLTRAGARDVDTVLVGGEVVLRKGKPTHIDVAAAGEALAESLAGTPFPQEAAEMVETLLPHLIAYYKNWDVGQLVPYSVYNSRR